MIHEYLLKGGVKLNHFTLEDPEKLQKALDLLQQTTDLRQQVMARNYIACQFRLASKEISHLREVNRQLREKVSKGQPSENEQIMAIIGSYFKTK